MRQPLPHRRQQVGITLVEALVAMLIMAFGMVALSGLQTSLRRSSDDARQRTDAARIAQQTLESLRGFSQIQSATPSQAALGIFGYNDIASSTSPTAVVSNATSFNVSQTVTPVAAPPHLDVTVTVDWTDRAGTNRSLSLIGKISPVDPALAMAARFAPAFPISRSPFERHEAIPTAARDLGQGFSAAAPPGASGVFWVFNNITGRLTGICNVANRTLGTLTNSDIGNCQTGITGGAFVVSGYIRYATGTTTPSADTPASVALPVQVLANLTLSGAQAPACYNDSGSAAGAGQTYASYMCAIYPSTTSATPMWAGRIDLAGITLGTGGYSVYRYSADYDGNGTIDTPEHPRDYQNVSTSLSKQNFLVVDYAANAPTSTQANPTAGRYIDTSVVLHQP